LPVWPASFVRKLDNTTLIHALFKMDWT
jgi:hypothetical protein